MIGGEVLAEDLEHPAVLGLGCGEKLAVPGFLSRDVQPDAERGEVYDMMYARYRDLYARLAPFFQEGGNNPTRRAATTR